MTLQLTRDFTIKVIERKKVEIMTLQLKVPNMACSACGDTITKAIKEIDPTATVRAEPKTKLVEIETKASEAEISQAITAAGYTVT
ncbi:heavy metal transport/detoxification protein (plasmid) [Chondrocystis sp. NIES-4102]|nr:heavy metal transport/detoxification protein [Chondrocystis sp. NIES-4102]